jgi:pyridoxine 5-phosphate synthase
MVAIAIATHPDQVTLVPERREEVTTEGGLDVVAHASRVERAVRSLRDAGIRTSLFIDPDLDAVRTSHLIGAEAIELHTGEYANHPDSIAPLEALRDAARVGAQLGLAIHAGHGLTHANLGPVSAIPEIEELNIGHSIISRAVFLGLAAAVTQVRNAMDSAR